MLHSIICLLPEINSWQNFIVDSDSGNHRIWPLAYQERWWEIFWPVSKIFACDDELDSRIILT